MLESCPPPGQKFTFHNHAAANQTLRVSVIVPSGPTNDRPGCITGFGVVVVAQTLVPGTVAIARVFVSVFAGFAAKIIESAMPSGLSML